MPCDESWIYWYNPETKRQSSQWKHAGSPRPKKARQSKSNHKLLIIPFFLQHWHDLYALGSHWTDSQQGILCWGFKGVQEEILSEEASTLQIGVLFKFVHRTMHQSTTPSLSQTIWPRWASRQFLTLSIVQTLLPVTFGYSLSSRKKLRGCRYETIEEMKEAVTKVIDTLTQEDFYGAFQKLLECYNKCIAVGGDYFKGD